MTQQSPPSTQDYFLPVQFPVGLTETSEKCVCGCAALCSCACTALSGLKCVVSQLFL